MILALIYLFLKLYSVTMEQSKKQVVTEKKDRKETSYILTRKVKQLVMNIASGTSLALSVHHP